MTTPSARDAYEAAGCVSNSDAATHREGRQPYSRENPPPGWQFLAGHGWVPTTNSDEAAYAALEQHRRQA